MSDKEANSLCHARQVPAELVAESVMTAERELAAFYKAVLRRYGLKEGRKAAQDWIEELETFGSASRRRAPRLASCDNRWPIFLLPEASTTLGVDDGQCGRFQ